MNEVVRLFNIHISLDKAKNGVSNTRTVTQCCFFRERFFENHIGTVVSAGNDQRKLYYKQNYN